MQNVIVTGGSRGLGLAMVRTLAAAGYRIIALARGSTEELTAASRAAADGGCGAIEFRACDLSDTVGGSERWSKRCAPISARSTDSSTTRGWARAAFSATCEIRRSNG